MASVILIKFLDKYVGYLICLILALFSSKPKKTSYKKILLIQLWGIGETVLCLPTIKELRKHYKNSEIDILTTKRVNQVFNNNKNINDIKTISLNPFSVKWFISMNFKKYDLVIDMEEYLNTSSLIAFWTGKERIGYNHGIRSKLYTQTTNYNDIQHTTQTFMDLLKPLGIKSKVKNLETLNYSAEDKKNVDALLKIKRISGKLIALSPGAAESARFRMWKEERWAELIKEINKKYNVKILMVGNGEVRKLNRKIIEKANNPTNTFNLAGETSLTELFALMEKISLMIAIDSGPMHVAAAQDIKTIGLFGPNTPVRFSPFGKKNISIYKPVASPVINVHKGEVPSHSKIDFMDRIEVKDVMAAVKKLLK